MNPLQLICRARSTISHQYGNINPLSIAYATRLGLGPTNPGTITVAQETLLFRWAGFSPALWLLIPAFSLDNAPRLPSGAASVRYQRSSTAPHQTNPMQSPYLR
jgi:hypothetical protein